MKGTIIKTENGWEVINIQATLNGPLLQSLPLHPDDVKKINEWSQVFDHIESRIASDPEVEFEIIENLGEPNKQYAKLINHNE